MAAASVSSTLRARARSPMSGVRGGHTLHDGVDRDQPVEKRVEAIQLERVLRVALCARGLFVYFEENAVDAGCDAGRSEWLDVLSLTRRDAVARSRQLQAMG